MKDPAVLFYTQDFLSGCHDLDMEERGQYITLLCIQHQKGYINEKTIRLSVGSVSVSVMAKFLEVEPGKFQNKRMAEEADKRRNFVETRRKNGGLGGRPKKNTKPNGLPYAKPNGSATDNHMENEDDNDNIYKKGVIFLKKTDETNLTPREPLIDPKEAIEAIKADEPFINSLRILNIPDRYIFTQLTKFPDHCARTVKPKQNLSETKKHFSFWIQKNWRELSAAQKKTIRQ